MFFKWAQVKPAIALNFLRGIFDNLLSVALSLCLNWFLAKGGKRENEWDRSAVPAYGLVLA
jgi:hypothetical protein